MYSSMSATWLRFSDPRDGFYFPPYVAVIMHRLARIAGGFGTTADQDRFLDRRVFQATCNVFRLVRRANPARVAFVMHDKHGHLDLFQVLRRDCTLDAICRYRRGQDDAGNGMSVI